MYTCNCILINNHDIVTRFESRQKVELKFSGTGKGEGLISCNMYKLTVKSVENEFFVSIHQRDKRCLDAQLYIDIGVSIIKATKHPEVFTYFAASGNSSERQNQLDIKNLPPGDYYVVPTSTGTKMEQYRLEKQGTINSFEKNNFSYCNTS